MKKIKSLFFLLVICQISLGQTTDTLQHLSSKSATSMADRWELNKQYKKGYFKITPYKPIYITAGRYSNNPNSRPTSENPDFSLPFRVNYNNYEAKFQLSLKTKLASGLFLGHGDLWIAYTQKAHWQVYNVELSRPFRELNYEPEIILNFATNYNLLGFKGSMLGISLNHQSNGRTLPLSRSWNRIIFHVGFERPNWQVMLRPWIRLSDEIDENPAILDYIGRGELLVVRKIGKCQLSFIGTHPLKFENGSRGRAEFNFNFPVINGMRGFAQVASGYGETLIDYNHSQNTIGLGISLVEW